MIMGHGKMHWIKCLGAWVWLKKYTGTFSVQSLQDKADTGLWFTYGQPSAEQGEGRTPEAALGDAIDRTRDRILKMNGAISALEGAARRIA
jgi:hypothetical protein